MCHDTFDQSVHGSLACEITCNDVRASHAHARGCHKKFGPGEKVVLGPFFAAKNGPRTKLALQNLVHVGKFGLLVY